MAVGDALGAPGRHGGVEHVVGRRHHPRAPELSWDHQAGGLEEGAPFCLAGPGVLAGPQGRASQRPEGHLGVDLVEPGTAVGPAEVHFQDLLGQREGLLADPRPSSACARWLASS